MSLLLGVIQRSNKIIMDDRQTIFGRQSVSLPNFFVAEDIVHFLPKFVATWNPPLTTQPTDAQCITYQTLTRYERRGGRGLN